MRFLKDIIIMTMASLLSPIAMLMIVMYAKRNFSEVINQDFVLMLRYASAITAINMAGMGTALLKYNDKKYEINTRKSTAIVTNAFVSVIVTPAILLLYYLKVIRFESDFAVYALIAYSAYVSSVNVIMVLLRMENKNIESSYVSIILRTLLPLMLVISNTLFYNFGILLFVIVITIYIKTLWNIPFTIDAVIIRYGIKRMLGDIATPLLFGFPVYWLSIHGEAQKAASLSIDLMLITAIITVLSPLVDLTFSNIKEFTTKQRFGNVIVGYWLFGIISAILCVMIPVQIREMIGSSSDTNIWMLVYVVFFVQVYMMQPLLDYSSSKQILVRTSLLAIVVEALIFELVNPIDSIDLIYIIMGVVVAAQCIIYIYIIGKSEIFSKKARS